MAITWVQAANFTGLPAPVIAQLRGGVPGAADYEASIGTGTAAGELTQTGQFTWASGSTYPVSYAFDAGLNRVRLTIGATPGATIVQHVHPTPLTPERVFLLAVTRTSTQVTRWTNLAITATETAEVAALPDVISTGNGTTALLISGPFRQGFTLTGRFGFQWSGAMPLRSELLGMAKVVDEDAAWIPDEPRPRRRDPVFGYLLAFLMEDARRAIPIVGRGGDDERRRQLGVPARGDVPRGNAP